MLVRRRSGTLAHLWQRLTSPAPTLETPEDRRRARLLSSLQLTLIPITVLVLLVWRAVEPVNRALVLPISLIALSSMAAVYALSRTRHYRWGALLLISLLFATTSLIVMNTTEPFASAAAATVDFLAIALLFASFLLSVRLTLVVAVLGIVEVALLPLMLPGVLPITWFGRFTFLAMISALVMTVAVLRRRDQEQIEQQSRELAASEARYRQMFEKNQAIKLLIDPSSGEIRDANQAACRFYGYSYEQIRALKIADINTLTETEVYQEMARALTEERAYSVFRHRLASGEVRDVEVHSGPIDIDGQTLLFSIVHDITERKRIEEALRESEARSRATFEQAAVGIAQTGVDGWWLRVNQKVCDITGYTSEELLERTWKDITHPDDLDADLHHVERLLKGGAQTYTLEKRYIRKDDSILWVSITVSLVRTAGGDPAYFIAVIEDISQRKQAEAALRASEERYRIVSELISDYAYSFTVEPDGSFAHEWLTEDSYRRITGYAREEIDAQGKFGLFHPDDVPSVERSLETVLRGESSSGEVRIITKSGEVRWLHIYRRPLWDPAQGRVVQVLGVAQDITERKQAEEALRATNRMLEASRDTLSRLIQQIPIGIQVFDASGLCTDVNQAHLDIFGVPSRHQLVGLYNIFGDPMAASVGTATGARRALAGEIAQLGDLTFDFTRADPRYAATTGRRNISVTFFPITDDSGQIVNIVALNQDTTERKRAESQQLELAVEKERVQMLQHFIRDTSHDLRTPLTTIKTSLYLLARTIDDPNKRERYINVISDQASRLHQLLEDLLGMSRLDKASVEEFSFEIRSLNLLLQNVVAGYKEIAERKKHSLTLTVSPNLPPILVDDAQVSRALGNILTNALNYTPDGGQIAVHAFRQDDRIGVEIQDNGIGIHPEHLARIFDRFFRADAARGTESGGVGLGLTIARRIIEAHGGDIEVESQLGQGTTVRVWMPVVESLSD